MTAIPIGVNGALEESKPDYDAIIVGAGFGGLRMIHELRKVGLSNLKCIEAGSGVGGTWYWNRYPGARTDSESWVYIMNFSKELNADWKWRERFPRQPEVLEYLNHVADRFDMRKDIEFNTRIKSAHYEEKSKLWRFTLPQGRTYTSRFFISATGILSVGRNLPFKGVDKFKGESYKTFDWPKHEVDYSGKRVAVIGTGATAVQVIPIVAHNAKSVTVFQRTPNYVMPARNHPLTDDQMKEIKTNYEEVWELARSEMFGMAWTDSKATTEGKTEAQIKRVLERGWEKGGFRFIFETFADMLTNQKANDIASEFCRERIRAMVDDEETAEALCPDYALMAKRPPLGHYYYETFNNPKVKLVDVKKNPIDEITERGVKIGDGEYEVDMIIYAIGFDASTGALAAMDVRGRDNRSLNEDWKENLETFLGITVEGYPNMFMISAPQSPFANLPLVIDGASDWIGKVLAYMDKNGYTSAEPKREAVEQYCKDLNGVYEATVLPAAAKAAGSWYVGANIPGKPVRPLFWFGGVGSYFKLTNEQVEKDFSGLLLS